MFVKARLTHHSGTLAHIFQRLNIKSHSEDEHIPPVWMRAWFCRHNNNITMVFSNFRKAFQCTAGVQIVSVKRS